MVNDEQSNVCYIERDVAGGNGIALLGSGRTDRMAIEVTFHFYAVLPRVGG